MSTTAFQHAPIDRLMRAHCIRDTFARSPLFREAALSAPTRTVGGEVAVEVSFEGGPPLLAVVAGSEDEAYAVLHELARTMVPVEHAGAAVGEAQAPLGPIPG